jgi:hypothetical protein
MEADFTIRNHLDSVPTEDLKTFELLNKYKNPPSDIPLQQPVAPPSNLGGSNDVMIGNMLGQIQGYLQNLGNQRMDKNNGFDGFQLNIGADVLRWIILIVILIVLIWVILKVTEKRRNPLHRRMKKLEKQIKKLRSFKKNPKQLTKDDDLDYSDEDEDDEDDDFDL